MDQPLDELYFTWLYDQVGAMNGKDPNASYWKLLTLLHCKEFVWVVPNDDNRAEDGRDLRHEFIAQERIERPDSDWFRLGCSMLELLIGISRRLAFEGDGVPRDWFWELISNLGLINYRDGRRIPKSRVEDILDAIVWRTYQSDGQGGLFPLRYPDQDQRDVEIWYQLNAYLLERV